MKKRPVQYFTDEYLELCKSMTPLDILRFEEEFRELMAVPKKIIPNDKKEIDKIPF